MDKSEKAQMYVDFLKAEGYLPEIDSDGDVRFKKEGGNYYIAVDATDDEFFRVVFPGFWPIESEEERDQALAKCNEANAGAKVAKVFIVQDSVWASLELFVSTPDAFKGVFSRGMGALRYGVERFVQGMRGD